MKTKDIHLFLDCSGLNEPTTHVRQIAAAMRVAQAQGCRLYLTRFSHRLWADHLVKLLDENGQRLSAQQVTVRAIKTAVAMGHEISRSAELGNVWMAIHWQNQMESRRNIVVSDMMLTVAPAQPGRHGIPQPKNLWYLPSIFDPESGPTAIRDRFDRALETSNIPDIRQRMITDDWLGDNETVDAMWEWALHNR